MLKRIEGKRNCFRDYLEAGKEWIGIIMKFDIISCGKWINYRGRLRRDLLN